MPSWGCRKGVGIATAAVVAVLLAAGAGSAEVLVSLKTGPVAMTVGPELELSVAPRVAVAVSAAVAGLEQGGHLEVLTGSVRGYFRPQPGRWLVAAYVGAMRPVTAPPEAAPWLPLLGASAGYQWRLSDPWRASVELGAVLTILPILVVPVPIPLPVLAIGVGRRL